MVDNSVSLPVPDAPGLEPLSGSPASDAVQGELHLRFRLNTGDELALAATGVQEVIGISPEWITPVPNVPPVVLGAYNFRGQVIWVADLGQFLGLANPLSTSRSEVSVVVVAYEGLTVGLAVDQVVGVDWLDHKGFRPAGPGSAGQAPIILGEWSGQGEGSSRVQLLQPAALLQSGRWIHGTGA